MPPGAGSPLQPRGQLPGGAGATGKDPAPETAPRPAPRPLPSFLLESLARASHRLNVARSWLAWGPGKRPVWRGHRVTGGHGMADGWHALPPKPPCASPQARHNVPRHPPGSLQTGRLCRSERGRRSLNRHPLRIHWKPGSVLADAEPGRRGSSLETGFTVGSDSELRQEWGWGSQGSGQGASEEEETRWGEVLSGRKEDRWARV